MALTRGEKNMNATKELQEEMIGVLTAISIVSKRLASRLMVLEQKDTGQAEDGQAEDERSVEE